MFAIGIGLVVLGFFLSSQGEYVSIVGDWSCIAGYVLMLFSLLQVAWRYMP